MLRAIALISLLATVACVPTANPQADAAPQNDIKLEILTAKVNRYEDIAMISVRETNTSSIDYCELRSSWNDKIYTYPDVYYQNKAGKLISAGLELPQFSDSPLEPETYVFVRFPAGSERTYAFATWDDYIEPYRPQIPHLQAKIGRIFFPCSEIVAANFPTIIEISKASNVIKLERLYKTALSHFVQSAPAPIKLRP